MKYCLGPMSGVEGQGNFGGCSILYGFVRGADHVNGSALKVAHRPFWIPSRQMYVIALVCRATSRGA